MSDEHTSIDDVFSVLCPNMENSNFHIWKYFNSDYLRKSENDLSEI